MTQLLWKERYWEITAEEMASKSTMISGSIEQDRNIESFPHDDGTVFRLIEADRAWARGWCSKQVEVDLKAIEKRPALYAAFSALRPFVGLWESFQKGTLHRFNRLKCDHVGSSHSD
jgi:hypothetical protein